MTPDEQRQSLIDETLPTATSLVESVHDLDIPATQATIAGLLDEGDRDHVAAVIINLAAMVPAHARVSDLLAWTVFDYEPQREQLPYDPWSAGEGERRCTACERILPLHEFHFDRSRKSGRSYKCRICRNRLGPTARSKAEALASLLEQGETVAGAARLVGVKPVTAREYLRRLKETTAGEAAA